MHNSTNNGGPHQLDNVAGVVQSPSEMPVPTYVPSPTSPREVGSLFGGCEAAAPPRVGLVFEGCGRCHGTHGGGHTTGAHGLGTHHAGIRSGRIASETMIDLIN